MVLERLVRAALCSGPCPDLEMDVVLVFVCTQRSRNGTKVKQKETEVLCR